MFTIYTVFFSSGSHPQCQRFNVDVSAASVSSSLIRAHLLCLAAGAEIDLRVHEMYYLCIYNKYDDDNVSRQIFTSTLVDLANR